MHRKIILKSQLVNRASHFYNSLPLVSVEIEFIFFIQKVTLALSICESALINCLILSHFIKKKKIIFTVHGVPLW